jgi:acyl carrier protein phosphodiesterase
MKIIVYYRNRTFTDYETGLDETRKAIWRVDLYDRFIESGKSPEVIEKCIADYNSSSDSVECKVIELPDEMTEVITFLLGEKHYKRYSDMDDLDSTMNELSADISNIHDDVWNMRNKMDYIEEMFKKFKEKYVDESEEN